MIGKKHREYDFEGTDGFIIWGKSRKEIYSELNRFIKQHGTDKNTIWVYENPVRPSKENLRPEYSMEVQVENIEENKCIAHLFYHRVH